MADDARMTLPGGVTEVGEAFAEQASRFVETLTHVASGATPEAAIPVLLLATTDVLASGEFEPDSGPDTDVEPLRLALARILDGLDAYPEVVDPVLGPELDATSLSDGLTEITLALTQGLAHHDAGHTTEALWWWQFSYLSGWGATAASAARVLASILGHLRLDVEDDVAAEAEYDALQRHTT